MSNAPDTEFCAHCGLRMGRHKPVAWWHIHRRLYDWTVGWTYRPSSSVALFALSFSESIIFPVPPDVLLIPLVLGNRRKWLKYAALCSIASVAGAVAAFLIGWLAWWAVKDFAFEYLGWTGLAEDNFDTISLWFERWNFWIIFAAGFTPLPFKVFNIFAGVFGTGPEVSSPVIFFVLFLTAATVSRTARFFLVAGLMRAFGAKMTPFIEKYFNWLSIAFAALLIGGFVVAKYAF
ncbi:MAG: DedA family protein [Planctomycetota bacterium]|nr:DedA family protein [Planctomycetota bacterium]